MLTELRIENFAIIQSLELELGSGLITFTGETGAGKSIILDAIETVLGGRVDADAIRSGAERASIEAVFRVPATVKEPVNAILEREELLDEPDYLSMGRDLRREGRTTARVNGRIVNVSLLRELGAYLVDIHGQSEHLSLLNVHQHLGLLDRYASTESLLETYASTYGELHAVRKELSALREAEKDAARKTELLTYQLQEIETARLKPGEEDELRQDRNRLANAEALASLSQQALQVLDEGTPESPAVTDLMGQAAHALSNLARLDATRSTWHTQAESALESLADLARELRSYLEEIEFNPKRLEQLEERLDLIHQLKRKYGGAIESILAFGKSCKEQLDTIAHATQRIADLETQEGKLLDHLAEQGEALSQKRHRAAEEMSKAIEGELVDLRMSGARFSVDFERRPDPQGAPLKDGTRVAFDSSGLDRVEFLVAPNPGEGLKPLARIASGGETSRLMLALKNILVQADTIPTLIFDEIDQGIGGRVGLVIGEKLWNLGRQHQVLCVTHLPQLAAFGGQHFRVIKLVQEGRTITRVEELAGEGRRQELALMLGGISEGTLRSAEEILLTVSKQTSQTR
jgi:DNA repair protein RecN (Recombination protein N)